MGLIGVIAPFRLEVGFGLDSIFFKDFFFSSFGCKGESLKIFLRTIIQNKIFRVYGTQVGMPKDFSLGTDFMSPCKVRNLVATLGIIIFGFLTTVRPNFRTIRNSGYQYIGFFMHNFRQSIWLHLLMNLKWRPLKNMSSLPDKKAVTFSNHLNYILTGSKCSTKSSFF